MKVTAVKFANRKATVYDFETPSHTYLLKGGLISHNTQEMYSKTVVSGGCLPAGELISMADGSLKAVEDIAVDDLVDTLAGPQPVTAIWNPETLEFGNADCFELTFSDGSKVRCSNQHPFWVGNNWIDAEDLNVGDKVSLKSSIAAATLDITAITPIGPRPLYDITVGATEHYVLSNGVITHNTGIYYSANQIFIIGRQQNKDGDEVVGYNFVINIEKSRYVREKSKVPITVSFEGGISKWSGLLDIALESGHVVKPKAGWYQRVNMETGEVEAKNYRMKDTENAEFWIPVLKSASFGEYIRKTYQVAAGTMQSVDPVSDEELEESINA